MSGKQSRARSHPNKPLVTPAAAGLVGIKTGGDIALSSTSTRLEMGMEWMPR